MSLVNVIPHAGLKSDVYGNLRSDGPHSRHSHVRIGPRGLGKNKAWPRAKSVADKFDIVSDLDTTQCEGWGHIQKANARLQTIIARVFAPNDENDQNFWRDRIGFSSTPDCGVPPETVAPAQPHLSACEIPAKAPMRQIILRRRPEAAPHRIHQ